MAESRVGLLHTYDMCSSREIEVHRVSATGPNSFELDITTIVTAHKCINKFVITMMRK